MRVFRKIFKIIIIPVLIVSVSMIFSGKTTESISSPVDKVPIKVGVLLYRFDDEYISLVKENLEEIQKKNEGKIEFTFYNGENDQLIQNKTINTLVQNKEVDLLLLNLVDTRSTKEAIDRIKEKNIPVVLFNREPVDINAIRSYNKAYFVGTDAKEAGVLQGKILIDLWRSKEVIDRNKDNILQYVMLMGERDNLEAIDRTKYSILTINNSGIKTQEIALRIANWNKDVAKNMMEPLILQYGNKIEAIIANNDAMAIGAIETLQKYGYNLGDKTKTITVIGVDAIPRARELIREGIMTGTVLQDASAMAEALYTVGMNLVYNRNPLEDTDYKADETGIAIRIPYKEYIMG